MALPVMYLTASRYHCVLAHSMPLLWVIQYIVSPLMLVLVIDATHEHEIRLSAELAEARQAQQQAEEVSKTRKSFLRYGESATLFSYYDEAPSRL